MSVYATILPLIFLELLGNIYIAIYCLKLGLDFFKLLLSEDLKDYGTFSESKRKREREKKERKRVLE